MRRSTIPAAIGVCFALAVSVTGCGSGSDDKAATTSTAVTSTAPPTTGTTAPPRDEPKIILAPVLAVAACPDSVPRSTTTTTTTAPPTTTSTTEKRFNNLVGNTAPPATTTPEASSSVPGAIDGRFHTADGQLCYLLGPVVGSGSDLQDATISQAGGQWQVLARTREASVAKLNKMFNTCFTAAPTCPAGGSGRGAVAIAMGDTVLYAPAIQAEDVADGPFSLGGGLSEREARDLASLINS